MKWSFGMYFPALAAIAEELVKRDLPQKDISKLLGITPSAASQYVSKKKEATTSSLRRLSKRLYPCWLRIWQQKRSIVQWREYVRSAECFEKIIMNANQATVNTSRIRASFGCGEFLTGSKDGKVEGLESGYTLWIREIEGTDYSTIAATLILMSPMHKWTPGNDWSTCPISKILTGIKFQVASCGYRVEIMRV